MCYAKRPKPNFQQLLCLARVELFCRHTCRGNLYPKNPQRRNLSEATMGFCGQLVLVLPTLLVSLLMSVSSVSAQGMFEDRTAAIPQGTSQLNYGVAVTNVGDGDGPMEWVVAGFSGANLVLQYDPQTGKYRNIAEEDARFADLRDTQGAAIGVCACDIDGDGLEEIYFLNTNNRYSGPKLVRDRLFKWRNNKYEDLFSDDINARVSSMYSGRSVACVDRTGSGKYGILLATYAQDSKGKFGLIEMNEYHPDNDVGTGKIVLHNVAEAVGIDFSTGGRGIAVGPIIGDDGFSDIYFVNEGNNGLGNRPDNSLFVNDGSGRFTNMAAQTNLNDPQPGRGVSLADFNNDGKTDIVYGNWMGPHRLQIQNADSSTPTFFNAATQEFATSSPIRTVIAADFDNSGTLHVFMNNIVYRRAAPNNLYRILPEGASVGIVKEDIGDAQEPNQYGTGAAVADIDQDGVLELLVAHGESKSQGLTFYHVTRSKVQGNKWLRVLPLTQFGAPARGAKVTLSLSDGRKLTRIVDGGSGYLCEMEPIAHFGIGHDTEVRELKVIWPDNHQITKMLTQDDENKLIEISHTGSLTKIEPAAYSYTQGYETKINSDGRDSAVSQVRRGSLQNGNGRSHYRQESRSRSRSSSYLRNSRLSSNRAGSTLRGRERTRSSSSYDRERERARQAARAELEKKHQAQREAELERRRQTQRRRELVRQRKESERRRRWENARRARLTNTRETAPTALQAAKGRSSYVRKTSTTEDPRVALRRIARERAQQRAAARRNSYNSRRTANRRQSYNSRRIYRGRTASSTARPNQYRTREYYRRLAQQRQEAARRADEQRRRSSFRRAEIDRARGLNYDINAASRRRETAQRRYEPRYRTAPPRNTVKPGMITKTTASPSVYDARRRPALRNRERYAYSRPRPTPSAKETNWGRKMETRRRYNFARATTARPTRRSYTVDRRRYHGARSGQERYRAGYRIA